MTEKQWYAWATPSGPINLMKAEDMPVKPEDWADDEGYLASMTSPLYARKMKAYRAALQAAKASAVPIGNKVIAVELINRKVREFGSNAKVWDSLYGKEGAIYGPFTVGYRIQDVCAHDSCPVDAMCEHCKEPVQVAILYDYTPEKEPQEDQETLWREVDRIFNVKWTFGMPDDVMQELKEKFKITRKQ